MNDVPQTLAISIGDAEVPYLQYGAGKKEASAVVLLHATGFPPQLWHPVARELSQNYRLIVPFYSDHREAQTDTGAVDWMVLARDLAVFCRALEVTRPFIVGHSMGATVAALSESSCGLNAAALVLIEPIFLISDLYGIPFTAADHPFASKSIKRVNYWRDDNELRQYLSTRSLFQKWDSEILELYMRYGFVREEGNGIRLLCSPQREAALFMGGMQKNPWPLFIKIGCPALVLEGGKSENRLYVELQKAASLMPKGSYAMMPDAGHLIPMEKPEETAAAVKEYFDDVDGRAGAQKNR